MRLDSPVQVISLIVVIFFGIGLHEFAHAFVAELAGDPTPRSQGRVTLNLFKHFDPLGALFILMTAVSGYGIGWGKPVIVNPNRMRNPRWGHFWSVAAGPLCNLLQAFLYGMVIRFAMPAEGTNLATLVVTGLIVNLSLCFFNLIPFGPLDGHWLIGAFLPEPARTNWYRFSAQTGTYILFGAIILSQMAHISIIGAIIGPPVEFTARLILGGR